MVFTRVMFTTTCTEAAARIWTAYRDACAADGTLDAVDRNYDTDQVSWDVVDFATATGIWPIGPEYLALRGAILRLIETA